MSSKTEQRKIDVIMNGQQVNASLKDMQAAASVMNAQLKKMGADDPGREKLKGDFKALRNRIEDTRKELYGVQKASNQAQMGMNGMTKGAGLMGTAFKGAMAALLPLLAFQKLFSFLDSSKEKFNQQAQAVAQLDATLKSTGNSAGFTSQELQKMASDLQGKTLFGDETTIQAQSLLLTFTDIKKGVFEDALPAIQDMAQKMAGDGPADLKGATLQVGKALNDPIKGISALSKVGVSFTEEQKATIKTLTEMGDKAGAQKLILAELNKEFGGSAEAARKAGTGGWKAFMNTVGDVQEMLGGKLAQGLNMAANFFSLLIEKSDPLVAVFKEIWAIGAELYDEIYSIAESLGFVSDSGETAGIVIDILTGIFTAVLFPIRLLLSAAKGLASGFIDIYNGSEKVRGTIGGLVAVFKNVVDNIKNSGLLEIMKGIFTLDMDKIQEGMKKSSTAVGKSAADAFAEGYASNKDNKIIRKVKEDAEEIQATTLAVAEETGEKQKQLTEKQLKEKKRLEEKHQKEVEKAREQYNAAYAKSELEMAKLKIELMENGVDKVLAKLRFQHEQELIEINQHRQKVVENIAITEEEKQALLDQYAEKKRIKDHELELAEKTAKEEARAADKEKYFEQLEEEEEYQMLAREEQFLRTFDSEAAREQALRDLHKETLDQKLAYLQELGLGETAEALKIKNQLLGIEKDRTDKAKAMAKERADFENTMAMSKLEIATSVFDGVMDLLDKESSGYQLFVQMKKVLSMAEIAMNLQQELSLNAVAAAKMNAAIPGSGVVYLAVNNVKSIVRAGMATAKIMAFADGGMTKGRNTIPMAEVNGAWQMISGHSGGSIGAFADGGWVNNAQLGLIGEAGRELVLPNWLVESPKYANIVGFLDSEIRNKGIKAFAAGGFTDDDRPISVPYSETNNGLTKFEEQMLQEFRWFKDEISTWQRELQVHNNIGDTRDKLKVLNELESKAFG